MVWMNMLVSAAQPNQGYPVISFGYGYLSHYRFAICGDTTLKWDELLFAGEYIGTSSIICREVHIRQGRSSDSGLGT